MEDIAVEVDIAVGVVVGHTEQPAVQTAVVESYLWRVQALVAAIAPPLGQR